MFYRPTPFHFQCQDVQFWITRKAVLWSTFFVCYRKMKQILAGHTYWWFHPLPALTVHLCLESVKTKCVMFTYNSILILNIRKYKPKYHQGTETSAWILITWDSSLVVGHSEKADQKCYKTEGLALHNKEWDVPLEAQREHLLENPRVEVEVRQTQLEVLILKMNTVISNQRILIS